MLVEKMLHVLNERRIREIETLIEKGSQRYKKKEGKEKKEDISQRERRGERERERQRNREGRKIIVVKEG